MLKFYDTVYLWALAAIPLLAALYMYVLARKKKTARKIGDVALVQQLAKSHSPRKALLKFALVVAAFAICALALANLKKPEGNQSVNLNGIDVMFAVDVSKSMMAQDIKPNRLERAKQLLTRLTAKLVNNRIGIVVFAGHAYIQMPLTADNNAARLYISSINTNMVPVQGTVVGDALKMCYNSFSNKEKKYKAVILLSDGEDHDDNTNRIAASMAEDGIVLHTVGFGSPEGAPIVDEATNEIKKDKDGNTVISKLNEEALRQIASKGKGSYQLFTSSDEVAAKLEDQLNNMEKRAVSATSGTSFTHYFPWFLLAALVLLVAELFISERKSRKQLQAALAALLLFLSPCALTAQNTKAQLKKGNEAYNKQEYDKAATEYKNILTTTPTNTVAQYNLGNALYKQGEHKQAVAAYEEALEQAPSKMKAAIYYNQGVALQKSNQLAECITAYKQALKLDPSDADARMNLQKALQQQKKEQEQQPKPKPQKNKQQDPKEKKEEPKDPDKNNQPKPQPSKLTQKQAEEKLKALLQEEKNLQEKLRKAKVSSLEKPEKDW